MNHPYNRTMGEICDEVVGIIRTGPFGSQLHKSDYRDEGLPVVMPKNIINGKIVLDGIARIGKNDEYRLKEHKLIKGDFVYARRGDIGRCALIRERENGWLCGTGSLRISLGNNVVAPDYLFYYLNHPYIISWIQNQAVGATMPNLNTAIIRNIPISYPPLPTQRKIAAILSAYDDLIENNTRRIKILEEMAQALYRHWFVDFKFPGHEGVRMLDSGTELGLVPEGWEVKKLTELVQTQYGYTESASEVCIGPKYVRGMDINKYTFINWDTVPYCRITETDFSRYKLNVGDVLIIRMADPGKVGMIEKDVEAVFASYLIRLSIVSDLLSPYYLFYSLIDNRYQGYITGASTGTTRKSASAPVITDFYVILPNKVIREAFETKIKLLRLMLNNLLDRNTNLRITRDLLLPKLVSGELDVSKLEIKEPGI